MADKDRASICSAAHTLRLKSEVNMYLGQNVGLCGANRIDSCALSVVVTIDETVSTIKKRRGLK